MLRLLPLDCPRSDDLWTPNVIPELLCGEDGSILAAGTTGNGKSVTLATIVAYLNQHVTRHILTLEGPIEYRYTSQRYLIHQREMDVHYAPSAAGLHDTLREDPDVILLDELRDTETTRLALMATETRYLVLATLHMRRVAQAIAWLVDTFPAQEEDPVRNQLADSLWTVFSQELEKNKLGEHMVLFELLVSTPAVGNLIREGKAHQLSSTIQTGQQTGMQTFTQSQQQRQARDRLQ